MDYRTFADRKRLRGFGVDNGSLTYCRAERNPVAVFGNFGKCRFFVGLGNIPRIARGCCDFRSFVRSRNLDGDRIFCVFAVGVLCVFGPIARLFAVKT